MTKQTEDVEVEAATTSDSSPEENEQEPVEETQPASEGEKTQDSDVEKRRLQAALREARERIRAEKAKRLEAEALISRQPAETLETGTPEEIQRRFVDAEARSAISYLHLKDPTIADRLDIIEEIMEKTGKTVEEADKEAKSILYDQVFTKGDSEANLTKTIKPAAVPEETPRKTTGNMLKDAQKGLLNIDPELQEILKRY